MSIIKLTTAIIMNIVGPRLVKVIWPILQRHLEKILGKFFNEIIEKVTNIYTNKIDTRTKDAEQKAQDAEYKANHSKNNIEAEKHQAVAKVWREVAEQFMRDNDKLNAELEELKTKSTQELNKVLKNMKVDLKICEKKPVLVLDGNITELPALPAP